MRRTQFGGFFSSFQTTRQGMRSLASNAVPKPYRNKSLRKQQILSFLPTKLPHRTCLKVMKGQMIISAVHPAASLQAGIQRLFPVRQSRCLPDVLPMVPSPTLGPLAGNTNLEHQPLHLSRRWQTSRCRETARDRQPGRRNHWLAGAGHHHRGGGVSASTSDRQSSRYVQEPVKPRINWHTYIPIGAGLLRISSSTSTASPSGSSNKTCMTKLSSIWYAYGGARPG